MAFKTIQETLMNSAIVLDQNTLTDIGVEGKIERHDPLVCYIDDTVQRGLDPKHTRNIAQNFKWDKAKIPSGYRDKHGRICITDGQHTVSAAARRGIREMNIYVFDAPDGATDEDFQMLQADQFSAINGGAKKMDRYTTHKTDLILKKSIALKVQKVHNQAKVTLIPASAKKQRMAASMSHIDIAYKMVTQISEEATLSAYRFHINNWSLDPIEPVIAWALARFFKQFDVYKDDGDEGAQYNEVYLYNALTADGRRDLKDIDSFLQNFFAETGARNANNGDIWRAKAIRIAYNKYVDKHGLGVDKKLDPTIY